MSFKRLLMTLTVMVTCLSLFAQTKITIKGYVIDKDDSEPLGGANIQVFTADEKFLSGVMVADDGSFSIHDLRRSKYSLKISYIGYIAKTMPLDLSEKKQMSVDLGYITLVSDAKMLQEAQVTATVAKVQVNGDSIQFNASAYRTPQGSTLEALVKLLPGAEVDDDGNITINGKSVSKILVDGKEFFLNDKSIAMKNFPVEMIEKIKTYDRKSDMARITGVDDGEEETVLDLSVKKGMKHGWFGNATAGAGTEHRYNARGLINHFTDNSSVTLLGNGLNIPQQGGWNRQNGLRSHKEGGATFASQSDILQMGGSVTYKYDGADIMSESTTRLYNDMVIDPFRTRRSNNYNSNHGVDANFKMEWTPDSMTTILFRPNFNMSIGRSMSHSQNHSYARDLEEDEEEIALLAEMITASIDRRQTYSQNTQTNGELQITRKLNDKGRNVTLRMTGGFTQGENKQLSSADVIKNRTNHEQNNRYYMTPSRNHNMMGQFTWNEPIADRLYLQMSYRFRYSYSKNDRQAFIYESNAYEDLTRELAHNRYDVEAVLRFMREADFLLHDTLSLSQFSEYRNYNQTISLQLRQVREAYNVSAGIDMLPQRSTLNYRYMGKEFPEVSRQVFNIAPRVNLRWNFSKTTNLQAQYRGRTNQPSMVNLLDIVDDSNPLSITRGNPGLKPSFSHNFNANFNSYKPETQRGLWLWTYGSATQNDISNKVIYDTTGVQTTIPMNINGNWNIGGGIGANRGLGEAKKFTVGGNVGGSYTHRVGYYFMKDSLKNISDESQNLKSITKSSNISLGLNSAYRDEIINIELRGNIRFFHDENTLNPDANSNYQNFWYGANFKWFLPWGTELDTDLRMNSRRGYSQKNMNTDELLWNVSVSHSFLKGNALTLKAEAFDILGQQTNITRNVSATSWSDSRNNNIYQYGMISLIYRFSVFAGKNTMGTSQERNENNPNGNRRR